MIRRTFLAALFGAVALFSVNGFAKAADEPFEQQAFSKMMAALQAQSMSDFTALGDASVKAVTPETFKKAADKFGPMIKAGYHATYLTGFKRGNAHMHYWKVEFKGQADDWLVRIASDGTSVSGFFINPP